MQQQETPIAASELQHLCLRCVNRERVWAVLTALHKEALEFCAQRAEQFVAEFDSEGHLTGEQVGDALAAEFRRKS